MTYLPEHLTFVVYFIFLMGVGIYFYKKTTHIEDYLLGGRKMGKWVTALSAQASDMSGWLLMGLPGAAYLGGLKESWIAIGLLIGTIANWIFVAPRIRVYTEMTRSMTLSSFFEDRFQDPTGLLRILSSVITLIFFTIYASSGLVAAGKLFESMFHFNYTVAVFSGAMVIVIYTFLGGFLAVCWTDLFQGTLMFFAIVIVPIVAFQQVGGVEAITTTMAAKSISLALIPDGFTFWGIVSTMAWGLGYFGQPHILARFMSIKSIRQLPQATTIAVIWVIVSLFFALVIGIVGIPMFAGGTESIDAEKVFILMIRGLFNPWFGGILLASILSAIMSTIDSQLLVSSSTLTEDFYDKIIKKNASEKELILVGRLCVVIISVIALFLALDRSNTILGLVSYAWGGFGAAFGPLVLVALFSRNTTWQAALAGMLTGTIVLIIWKQLGLGKEMYEIVPGFLSNLLVIFTINVFVKQDNIAVKKNFEQMVKEIQ